MGFKGEKSTKKNIFFLQKKSKFHFLKKMWDKLSATNQSIKNLVLGFFGSIFAFFYEFLYIKKENIWHNYISCFF